MWIRSLPTYGATSAALFLLAACGGTTITSKTSEIAPPSTASTLTTATTETPAAGTTSETTAAAKSDIEIEQSAVIYLPNQTGGKYHTAIALVRNTTDRPLQVQGQFAISDAKGLVGTADATIVTIPARSEGAVIADTIDLDHAVKKGTVELTVAATEPLGEPEGGSITTGHPRFKRDSFGFCSISAPVTSTLKDKQELAAVTLVGLKHGKIVTGGYTYPTLFPNKPAVVEVSMVSEALCPKGIDKLLAFASLPGF